MRRLQVLILVSATALGCSFATSAQEVYQWKDANGVTHFSQTPPKQGQYQQRAITHKGASHPHAPTQATAAAAENPQCTNARANLAALRSDNVVHEAGTDGTPGRVLSADERANQVELANAAIKAYCTKPAG